MGIELTAVAVIVLILAVIAFVRFASPVILLDLLDHLIWRLPARPFLAVVPIQDPILRSLTTTVVIVCGFGMVLILSRATGFWVVWPAAALVLFLAVGFGVAYATMVWPATLTIGLIALRFGMGWLDRLHGEPFADDGTIDSALNAMIALTFILASYATAVADGARMRSGQARKGEGDGPQNGGRRVSRVPLITASARQRMVASALKRRDRHDAKPLTE